MATFNTIYDEHAIIASFLEEAEKHAYANPKTLSRAKYGPASYMTKLVKLLVQTVDKHSPELLNEKFKMSKVLGNSFEHLVYHIPASGSIQLGKKYIPGNMFTEIFNELIAVYDKRLPKMTRSTGRVVKGINVADIVAEMDKHADKIRDM